MKEITIAAIPGDGIGREVVPAGQQVGVDGPEDLAIQ